MSGAVYLSVLLAVIGVDQITKMLVASSYALYEQVIIIPGFINLSYVTNRGAAFSILAGVDSPWRHYFFIAVGCIALLVIATLWYKMYKRAPWQGLGFTLIAGGALGNLIDRVRLGAVVDFIDIYWREYHWPAFNVADSAICIGVGLFLVLSFLEREIDPKEQRRK